MKYYKRKNLERLQKERTHKFTNTDAKTRAHLLNTVATFVKSKRTKRKFSPFTMEEV